jgi:DNA-binding MarR family transcriptional regulator
MSRLIDGLVRKELVSRTSCPNDRRHVRLAITGPGQAALDVAWKGTHVRLKEEVAGMTAEERETLTSAMDILRSTFHPDVVED